MDGEASSGAYKIIDECNVPHVVAFIKEQLAPFDTSTLESFRLTYFSHTYQNGYCRIPSRKSSEGYRLSAGVRPNRDWPFSCRVNLGRYFDPMAGRNRLRKKWVNFDNPDEVLIYQAGIHTFKFLRHSKQILGDSGPIPARHYGLDWLKKWWAQKWQRQLADQTIRHLFNFVTEWCLRSGFTSEQAKRKAESLVQHYIEERDQTVPQQQALVYWKHENAAYELHCVDKRF